MWRKGGVKPLGGERKGAEEEGWEEVWRDSALLTAVEVVLRPMSRKVEQNPSEHHSQASPAPSTAQALSQLLEVGQDMIFSLLGPRVY